MMGGRGSWHTPPRDDSDPWHGTRRQNCEKAALLWPGTAMAGRLLWHKSGPWAGAGQVCLVVGGSPGTTPAAEAERCWGWTWGRWPGTGREALLAHLQPFECPPAPCPFALAVQWRPDADLGVCVWALQPPLVPATCSTQQPPDLTYCKCTPSSVG